MLDDDSAAQIIYFYLIKNINQIIDEIEAKAKVCYGLVVCVRLSLS